MSLWWERYMGKPWAAVPEPPQSYTCGELVRAILRERCGIETPEVLANAAVLRECVAAMQPDRYGLRPLLAVRLYKFYGSDSFRVMADWLRAHEHTTGQYCLVGFECENTLSESGGVSRGICAADATHHLTHVEEHHKVAREADGRIYAENSKGERVEIPEHTLVSMNMWGFTPDYFDASIDTFKSFLKENYNELKAEFYIPYVIDCMLKAGTASVELLSTTSHWFGVTYKTDRPGVVAKFKEFADKGIYPTPLY